MNSILLASFLAIINTFLINTTRWTNRNPKLSSNLVFVLDDDDNEDINI